jgi:hypothetical protein
MWRRATIFVRRCSRVVERHSCVKWFEDGMEAEATTTHFLPSIALLPFDVSAFDTV